VCSLAQEKVRQTFAVIDYFTKAIYSASKNVPGFISHFKESFGINTTQSRKEFSVMAAQHANAEIKALTDHIQKVQDFKKFRETYDTVLQRELKAGANLSMYNIADQLKEAVDFNEHLIRRKNFKKRAIAPPSVLNISECYKIKAFDNLHFEKVNCVDICPFSKLQASGSSDGTIRLVDLEDLTVFSELTLKEPQKKGIFSLCIDDKHNITYVNEDNLLRVINLSLNHCVFTFQGQPLKELTDQIPEQTVQYTRDYRHLVFRTGPRTINFFLPNNNYVMEKKIMTSDKILDFSIAATCDYLATASYEALETEIYETTNGQVVSKYKFDTPIFVVQWAPNGIHLVYGAGNGKVYLLEFSKYHDKSLRVLHCFDEVFSVASNVAALSVSCDSQFAAVGSRNSDYRVKILNLWERCEQVVLPDNLHSFNVQAVKFSRNGKILATCSEDTTVKSLLLR
jgi:WD40 repeat protein